VFSLENYIFEVDVAKETINKKMVVEKSKPEQPPVIFMGEKGYASASLIYLGVVAVILGFLSTTSIMGKTIFTESADFIVGMGIVGIIVGLFLNNRKKILGLFDSIKKDK
jgi:hypothetical protein